MTVLRDPDAILAAWLKEGPTELPPATSRAVALAVGTAERTKRSNRREANGMTAMQIRLAVATLGVAVVVGAGVYVLGPRGQTSGAPPVMATPSASPAPTVTLEPSPPPTTWTEPYTSARFGYSIRYPAGWTVRPADPTLSGFDAFIAPGGPPLSESAPLSDRTRLSISISDLPVGMTMQAWAEANLDDPATTIDGQSGCRWRSAGIVYIPVNPSGFDLTVIGGRSSVIRSECSVVQAAVGIGDRVFVMVLRSRARMPKGDDALFAGFADTIQFPDP